MADAPAAGAPAAPAPTNGAPTNGAGQPAPAQPAAPATPPDTRPPWERLGLVHRKTDDGKELYEREVDDGRGGKRKVAIDLSDPDSFFRDHEYGTAGRKALSEAEREKKRASALEKQHADDLQKLGDALRNPKSRVGTIIQLAKAAGVESDVVGEIIAEHHRMQGMTAEQRELEQRRLADEERAEREGREKQTREQREREEGEVRLAEGLWTQTGKALEQAQLPDERIFRLHVTQWAAAALERHGDNRPIDFGEAAKAAHSDYVRVLPGVLEKMSDEALLATLGDKQLARIVTLYGARQRGGPPTMQTGDRSSTATEDRPEARPARPRRVPAKTFIP